MRRMVMVSLAAVAVAALLSTPLPAKALVAAPLPIPDRVALADVVVIGKLGKVEEKNVSALPYPGAPNKVEFQVLALQIDEALVGIKDKKEIRLGFVPPPPNPGPVRPPRPGMVFTTGQEGCFFLTKHPSESFYVQSGFAEFLDKKNPNFEKDLALIKRCAKLLDEPMTGLKSKDADEKLLTASLLIKRYRTPKAAVTKTEPIDAEQSKLILQTLAEADWNKNDPLLRGGPRVLFMQLGLTDKDGWKPPTRKDPKTNRELIDYQAIPAAAQKWLKDNAGTYRIQRFVVAEKAEK